jgi:PTS system nitrogen regulatory IIA component
MNKLEIADFLSPAETSIKTHPTDKKHLLGEMTTQAAARLGLNSVEVRDAVLNREELGSTGIGGGVAIPHARLAGLNRPFGMLARLDQPIEFYAVDGEPVDLVFLLLAPTGPAGDQLNALACIARRLRDPPVAAELRSAVDAAALYEAAAGIDERVRRSAGAASPRRLAREP